MTQEAEQKPEDQKTPPGALLLGGIAAIGVGIGAYYYFGHLETEGGRIRTHFLIILAYNTLGKAGVLGLFGILGGLLIAIGIRGIVKGE